MSKIERIAAIILIAALIGSTAAFNIFAIPNLTTTYSFEVPTIENATLVTLTSDGLVQKFHELPYTYTATGFIGSTQKITVNYYTTDKAFTGTNIEPTPVFLKSITYTFTITKEE